MHLVGAARRRTFTNLVCEQLSVGLVAAMGGAILLLLIGTQILDWWWPLVLFAGGAAVSAWRTMRLLPTPYIVAQIVDRKMELKDSISTAFHFIELPPEMHPFYVATQAHPEFKSRPNRPHPLFAAFVEAARQRAEGRLPRLPIETEQMGSGVPALPR